MKRLCRVDTKWTPELAYVIGIITTDGCLSSDGRHIDITSKDYDIVSTCKKCLGISNKIGRKARGGSREKKYFRLQFGDINFYEFLLSTGLTPNKSKTIKSVDVPEKYFADFLRGCVDGDGSITQFEHPESSLPQIRLQLASASRSFLEWIWDSIKTMCDINGGYIYSSKIKSVHTLSFGKGDAIHLLKFIYYKRLLPSLKRKRIIAKKFVGEW